MEEDLPEIIEEEPSPNMEENLITLAHFQDAGFIYMEEGEKNWVFFLARSLNSIIWLSEVRGDGIIISWEATPPSDAEAISVRGVTSLAAMEMNFHKSMCSLFVWSPQALSQDSSKIEKGPAPALPVKVKWLVISIPFETEKDLKIEMTLLNVE